VLIIDVGADADDADDVGAVAGPLYTTDVCVTYFPTISDLADVICLPHNTSALKAVSIFGDDS